MIKIKTANLANAEVLALLGRLTWAESHGQYIDDKNNLKRYLDNNFSVAKTIQNLKNPKQRFYIMYADDLPIGYAKIIVNAVNENVASQHSCRLERIFILNDFIPLKVGHKLLTFVEEQVKALQLDTIWLSVYIKNKRAIKFYKKNDFKNVGVLNFDFNEESYHNIVFSKEL